MYISISATISIYLSINLSIYLYTYMYIYIVISSGLSRASVLETLLTAQTRLVLQTRVNPPNPNADRHENMDTMQWSLEHRITD